MLWCVAGFGVCTILFGISHSMILSLIALVLVGATDMVSVIIRATLVQIATPDEMRGRVNAVDMIFIGASNELGQFESGITAHWFEPSQRSFSVESAPLSLLDCGRGCSQPCGKPIASLPYRPSRAPN